MNVDFRLSPSHSTPARDPDDVDMLVIHYAGMRDPSPPINAILNPHHKASYHYLIHPDGEKITCFVPPMFKAWHAGRSVFRGRKWCNGRSIGISFANDGTFEYSKGDMDALRSLLFGGFNVKSGDSVGAVAYSGRQRPLLDDFPGISADTTVTHQEIAEAAIAIGLRPESNPRFDPGPLFPWEGLLDEIHDYRRRGRVATLNRMHRAEPKMPEMAFGVEEMALQEDDEVRNFGIGKKRTWLGRIFK